MSVLDTELWLRADTEGTETSDQSETGINFNIRKHGPVDCVIGITSVDDTTDDETYVLNIQVSDLVGGTYTTIATVAIDNGTADGTVLRVPLNGNKAGFLDADCDWIRIGVDVGGTTPIIDYWAYLAPAHSDMGKGVAAGA